MNFEKFNALIEDIEETSRKYETIKDFPKHPEIESKIWKISSVLFECFKKSFLESGECYYIKVLTFKGDYYEKGHLSTKAKQHIA